MKCVECTKHLLCTKFISDIVLGTWDAKHSCPQEIHSLEQENKQDALCVRGYDGGMCQVLKGQEHGELHSGEEGEARKASWKGVAELRLK